VRRNFKDIFRVTLYLVSKRLLVMTMRCLNCNLYSYIYLYFETSWLCSFKYCN